MNTCIVTLVASNKINGTKKKNDSRKLPYVTSDPSDLMRWTPTETTLIDARVTLNFAFHFG